MNTQTSRSTVHWSTRILGLCLSLAGCKSQQLTSQAANVVTVQALPDECEDIGVVTGRSGGLLGGYVERETLVQSATEDAQQRAAKLGATHFVAQPASIEHGSAIAPTRNQQPAMGHGDSSSTTVSVTGTAYRCTPAADPGQIATRPPSGALSGSTTSPVSKAPSVAGTPLTSPASPSQATTATASAAPSISLAPLGRLHSVTVFQLIPATPRNEAEQIQVLKLQDAATLDSLTRALADAAAAELQFVPTYRIEFIGELGTQSILYGFGHLKYAGHSYQLPDTELERTLGLVTVQEGDEN